MIEINLVPDVKQELIKAQRIRTAVISLSIFIGAGFVAAVVLVSIYVFGAQTLRQVLSDNAIKSESDKLAQVSDLPNILTIQNQLNTISKIHDSTQINSRLLDVIATVVVDSGDNPVTISNFSIDTQTKMITIEAQTKKGYRALEAFKKTIGATRFVYQDKDSGQSQTVALTDHVNDGDRNYSQNDDGSVVLDFSINFIYPDQLFSRTAINAKIVGPKTTNATDSKLQVPSSIFTTNVSSGQEAQ